MAMATMETLEAFRERCNAFLTAHRDDPSGNLEAGRAFLAAATEAGLAGITYPSEFGGAGLTPDHDRIWREERSNFPAFDSEFIISLGMCVPMLAEFGTDDQKRAFLPDAISGRTLWCQMFSEPGAGSDVASLQTKAELDGDEWVVNGQKVWTTLAHRSDFGIVVVRTDPSVPKHAGVSMLIIDLSLPGVEIRPIHQIDGGSHFNEVYFTDVRLPKANLLGDMNNGWRLATAMLMYERVAIGSGNAGQLRQPLFDSLSAVAKKNGRASDAVVRDQLVRLYSLETAKSLVAMRTKAEQQLGKTPGPGGSLGKLFGSQISWYYRSIAQNIAGLSTIAFAENDPRGESLERQVLNSFQAGIAGGTDEIQRNIIGERVLGLPREPAVDRDVAFSELKVGTQRI